MCVCVLFVCARVCVCEGEREKVCWGEEGRCVQAWEIVCERVREIWLLKV